MSRWIVPLVALVFLGCSGVPQPTPELEQGFRDRLSRVPGFAWVEPVTAIAHLSKHPKDGRVFLQGQVTKVIPLLNQGLYQLKDETGQIWVFTRKPVPAVGTGLRLEVTIHYEPILIQGQDLGALYAQERRRIAPPPP